MFNAVTSLQESSKESLELINKNYEHALLINEVSQALSKELELKSILNNVVDIDIGVDRTSIYVVMSRTFQAGQLQPAWSLNNQLTNLSPGESVTFSRKL